MRHVASKPSSGWLADEPGKPSTSIDQPPPTHFLRRSCAHRAACHSPSDQDSLRYRGNVCTFALHAQRNAIGTALIGAIRFSAGAPRHPAAGTTLMASDSVYVTST